MIQHNGGGTIDWNTRILAHFSRPVANFGESVCISRCLTCLTFIDLPEGLGNILGSGNQLFVRAIFGAASLSVVQNSPTRW